MNSVQAKSVERAVQHQLDVVTSRTDDAIDFSAKRDLLRVAHRINSATESVWAGLDAVTEACGEERGMTMRKDLSENGRIILAHGEATGHCHEVVAAVETDTPVFPAAQFFEEPDGTRMLLVTAPCALRHQEHAPIALDPHNPIQWRQGDVYGVPMGPGAWRIARQREWDGPDQWRQVAD